MRGQGNAGADITGSTRPLTICPPLAVPVFMPLAIDLAWALDGWHQRVGPHAALCPDAVRIDTAGGVHLEPGRTAPASPIYAAPEQSGRLERGVAQRTDLYVLGVIYYQLLSGRLPYPADSATSATQLWHWWHWWHCHLSETPVPLADLVATLPHALGEIIHLLLEKSPDDRYQTARGLAV